MTRIQLDRVSVQFPIYSAGARSLKNGVMRMTTGGRIGRDSANRVCVEALSDVTLMFEHGDRVGLIGRNGAGKTTLLRVLAGIYEPSSGAIYRQGTVAALFEITLGMDHDSTGYENILMRGLLLGMSPKQIRARIDEIAAFTELDSYLHMPLHTYSTGMKLRLAFAVCTSIQPEIMLMDEWIGVGDAHFVDKAEHRLKELVGRAGLLVLASHSKGLLKRTCNKGVLLNGGKVKTVGLIDDVLKEYDSQTSHELLP